jgi:hypothetical protein
MWSVSSVYREKTVTGWYMRNATMWSQMRGACFDERGKYLPLGKCFVPVICP